MLQVTIDADGRVIEASGTGAHRLLCDNAERNVRLWTFGKPDSGAFVHTIVYDDTNSKGPPVNFSVTSIAEISVETSRPGVNHTATVERAEAPRLIRKAFTPAKPPRRIS